jgi:hypothetical protein
MGVIALNNRRYLYHFELPTTVFDCGAGDWCFFLSRKFVVLELSDEHIAKRVNNISCHHASPSHVRYLFNLYDSIVAHEWRPARTDDFNNQSLLNLIRNAYFYVYLPLLIQVQL